MSLILATALASVPPLIADTYELSFENAAYHEARISVRFEAVPEGPLTVRMARSSPGRYALHEFAKNVDDVSAVDAAGNALRVTRPDPYSWIIEGDHNGAVIVRYTLYGDRADGTYAQIDHTHAHLNAPASLMYAPDLPDRHAVVKITPYDPSWKVATQLFPSADPYVFTAPSRAYLMDSPIEVSDHVVRRWTVEHKGERAEIRIAAHTNLDDAELDDMEGQLKKIVDQQIRFWDDLPDFEAGTYTFLVDMLPWVDGDGMEHRNSTVITVPRAADATGLPSLNVFSHEFFHAWSVERLRPAQLEPFDFSQADVTQHLWFAEGFDSYLDGVLMHRAGVASTEDTLSGLAGSITFTSFSPAVPGSSPSEMSRLAPYLDAATSNDPIDGFNSKLSYYTYGAAVGLGLDLLLRTRFDTSLDAYMRALWERYGKVEQPYTDADLLDTLADVTGDRAFAEDFFATVVHGDQLPDYGSLLSAFGLELRLLNAEQPWLDFIQPSFEGSRAMLDSNTVRGSALYQAGLGRGDEIVSIDGRAIDSAADWAAAMGSLKPGNGVTIAFRRRGGAEGQASVKVGSNPYLEIVPVDRPTRQQLDRRQAWLGKGE
ncbi:PDZ domain-containing protein [Sphingomicrobium sp. XHP0235]|uniref:M61 family metallopeptidase n=1 Tax=Sphingomicrobium aquimarinum TaxID=3133971 RepID=UPI0031FEA163